jgi:hypothetical protein
MGWILALVVVVVAGVVIYDRTVPAVYEPLPAVGVPAEQLWPEQGRPADPRLAYGMSENKLPASQIHPEDGRPADLRLATRGPTVALSA